MIFYLLTSNKYIINPDYVYGRIPRSVFGDNEVYLLDGVTDINELNKFMEGFSEEDFCVSYFLWFERVKDIKYLSSEDYIISEGIVYLSRDRRIVNLSDYQKVLVYDWWDGYKWNMVEIDYKNDVIYLEVLNHSIMENDNVKYYTYYKILEIDGVKVDNKVLRKTSCTFSCKHPVGEIINEGELFDA